MRLRTDPRGHRCCRGSQPGQSLSVKSVIFSVACCREQKMYRLGKAHDFKKKSRRRFKTASARIIPCFLRLGLLFPVRFLRDCKSMPGVSFCFSFIFISISPVLVRISHLPPAAVSGTRHPRIGLSNKYLYW